MKESPFSNLRSRHNRGGRGTGSENSASSMSSSDTLQKSRTGSDDSDTGTVSYQETSEFTIALLEREENLRYGWGKCTPDCLQWCCTPQFLLISLMLIAFCQGYFAHGALASSIATLHSRFHFSMLEIGIIRCMYDFGLVVGFVPVVYIDAKGAKRAIWIGISCFVMALGALACALPHFIIDNYRHNTNHLESGSHIACWAPNSSAVQRSLPEFMAIQANGNNWRPSHLEESFSNGTGSMDNDTNFQRSKNTSSSGLPHHPTCEPESLNLWKYVFMVGVFMNGLGGAAYFTMGIAFLDDSVTPQKSILYTGALNAALLLGVFLSLIINNHIIRDIYVDFNKGVEPPAAGGPKWIGAWWLVMLTAALLPVFASLPMFGFPKQLPGVLRAHLEELLRSDNDNKHERDPSSMTHSSSVWKSIKVCMTNVTYLGLTLEQITVWAVITSFSAYMPAYLKAVYGDTGRTMTAVIVVFALLGSVTGTFIQYRFKLSILGNVRFSLAAAVAYLLFLGGIFITCEEGTFVGWTVPYPVKNSSREIHPNATCNMNCYAQCSRDHFHPICYRGFHPTYKPQDKVTIVYYSPCFAGCASENSSGGYNCSCVPNNTMFDGGGNIENKRCELPLKNCKYRAWAAVVCFCWCAMLTFVRLNPLQHSLLRCIPFKDRVVGLMMNGLLARVFGAMPPGPVVGNLMDGSCNVYDQTCGRDAQCQWRNENEIHMRTAIAAYAASIVCIVGIVMAYLDQKQQSKKANTGGMHSGSKGKEKHKTDGSKRGGEAKKEETKIMGKRR